mgnify:CR=1 FL=1
MLQCATLFLALSGFFLTGEIRRGGDGKTFLKKKFARIFPTYWLAIALAVLLRMAFQHTFSPHPHFWRIFFLIPLDAPYLLNGEWTLLCDMLYYLIGAIFISDRRSRFFPAFLAIWGSTLIVGVRLLYPNLGIHSYLPEMLIAPAHLSFLAGCCAWYAHERFAFLLQKISRFGLIFIEIFVFGIFICTNRGVPTPVVLIWRFVCYFFLILFGAQIQISPSNFVARIGDHSYGMYLAHWTVFSIAYPFLVKAGASWGIAYVVVLCCALVFSYQYGTVDIVLGVAVRKRLLASGFSLKKCLSPLVSCLCTMGLVCVVAVGVPYAQISAPRVAFDFHTVMESGPTSCGCVDHVKVTQIKEGIVEIRADGWGFDPVANQLVTNLVLVSGGEIIPASVSWHDRSAVGEVLNNPVLTTCGWSLAAPLVRMEMPADLAFYIQLTGGGYMELSLSPWHYAEQ